MRDVEDLVADKLASVRAADCRPESSLSFISCVEQTCLPFIQRTKRSGTFDCYETYFRSYVKPYLAGGMLRDFSLRIVTNILADAARAHKLNKKTIRKVRSILIGIFAYAIGTGAFRAKV